MRKKIILIFMAFLIILLSGCSPNVKQEEQKLQMESEAGMVSTGSYKKEYSENLRIDLTRIPDTYHTDMNKVSVEIFDPDLVQMQKILFPEDSSASEILSPDRSVEQLKTENGLLITKAMEGLYASTKEWDLYSDFIGFRDVDSVRSSVSADMDLAFMSREDAKTKVRDMIDSFYQEFPIQEIHVEAYTKEYMQDMIDNIEKDASFLGFIKEETLAHSWREEEEIYCVTATFAEQDMPILTENIDLRDGSTIWRTRIEVWMTKNGIQRFQADGLWVKTEDEKIKICSLDEVMETLAGKYRNIVSSEQMTVTEAELVYAPAVQGMNGERELVPFWILKGIKETQMNSVDGTEPETAYVRMNTYVNGETGRVVE